MTSLPPFPETDWAWFFDVDGTLSFIAESPEHARVDDRMLDLIARLQHQSLGAVAAISGRSIDDVDALFPGLKLAVAGQHGAERRDATGRLYQISVSQENLQAMRAAVVEMTRHHAGLLLEDKGLSLALHYRKVPRLGPFVLRELRAIFLKHGDGFQLQLGKCVVEVVAVGHTKGTVVLEFMTEIPFKGRRAVYLGDDVTDENAFAVVNDIGGVSIKVGAGPTVAQYRLIDVAAVRQWLESPSLQLLRQYSDGDQT
ncbi:MAG: trehalose-phosphatase [Gemmatimonadaceae bacterium]